MHNITKYLVEKSQGLLQIKDEINDWTLKDYKMFNTGSVEVEVAEFLYAMVRITKAKRILDLGSHFGVSALYMGQACNDNQFGVVQSVEHNKDYAEQALKLWKTCNVYGSVLPIEGSSLDFPGTTLGYDLILSDTEPDIRFKEVMKFYFNLNPGGYIFVHDLHRHLSQMPSEGHEFGWPFGELPQEMKNWIKDRELVPFYFPTPRGLTGFYRPRSDDYKV